MIIRNLSFAYRNGSPIFIDVNLELPMDRNTLLCGANGSGKTTLCRILAGLEPGYGGGIDLDGADLRNLAPAARSKLILYLKQETEFNLLATTADEDLEIWQNRFQRDDTREEWQRRQGALNDLDMTRLDNIPLWELSGGQKKRVGLSAVALMQNRFWILDEPDAGLDESRMSLLIKLLDMRRNAGYGALIVSHRKKHFQGILDSELMIHEQNVVWIK